MQIISDLNLLPEIPSGSVLTMGDFDGLHRGHRQLIEATVARARSEQLTSVLVTYEPSPKKILKKLALDSRLMIFSEKRDMLAKTDLDFVIFYPMTAETLRISARSFLRSFLLGRLRMRHLIMGDDHHFGHNRRGNAAYLRAAAESYGFTTEIIPEQKTGERRSSSSRIRTALAEGRAEIAAEILGRPYSISGKIVRGEARGRLLGFPTANLYPDPEKLLPATGVYYGMAVFSGKRIPAVANLGRKPTVGEHAVGLEVHLLDYSGPEIYGEDLAFEFLGHIRAETKFSDLEALKAQIARDIAMAKKKLS